MFGQNKEKPDYKSNSKQDNCKENFQWAHQSMEDLAKSAIKLL